MQIDYIMNEKEIEAAVGQYLDNEFGRGEDIYDVIVIIDGEEYALSEIKIKASEQH